MTITLDDVQRVRSRSVRWIGFSEAEQAFFVNFIGGRTYRYEGDRAMYMRLANAESKGTFVNKVLARRGVRIDATQIANPPW